MNEQNDRQGCIRDVNVNVKLGPYTDTHGTVLVDTAQFYFRTVQE